MLAQTDLLEALPAAICVADAEGRIIFYNQAAADLWGHRPEAGTARWCGAWRLYRPDGTPLAHADSPLAVCLRQERAVHEVEVVVERPDGSRMPVMPHASPLKDASGRITGAINHMVDLTERDYNRIQAARLASIVATSDDAIVSKTLDGCVTSWNDGAMHILGYSAEEMIGQPITRIIPPELHDEERQILAKLRRGEHVRHYESVRIAKDGRRVDISLSVSPLRGASGEVVGASKVARDISERKRAEQSQRLLVAELNHRVKNTLAQVQAIASLSSRRAKGLDVFITGFNGRLQALAKAHTLLAQARMEGAELAELIREQVLLGESGDRRITFTGPALQIGPQAAVHLAMVLHELATNARKYGALSVAEGRLSIGWELEAAGGRTMLLRWEEHGVPLVSAPASHGFGTTLIEQTLRSQGGSVTMRYGGDGIAVEIRLPLPEGGKIVAAAGALAGPQPHPGRASRIAGKRIVLIEDEPLIALDLEMRLTQAGCVIAGIAGTPAQAKEMLDAARYDAVLLDGNLAGDPVDELAIALTQRNIPFAFITGYSRDSLPHGFREAVIVTKPFSDERLLSAVESILGQAGAVPLRRKSS